ncbi:chemotaxis protein CheA [Aquicoccus sp. SU-CL01552]|uniref:chemotaxis protein CheA n=1 Tax=Aquicoccus sp. SU-CL01552 TaxID=3127656 RepID=UPI003104394B
MVQSNKVLTVSYGTFSCTLEGFEDSFDTMKAIAEYFRDLAADDRYFGAEPPQPDTEMLARIAEREVSRHVEARREGSGFVLRAAEVAAPAALEAAEAVQEQPAPEPQAEAPVQAPEQAAPEVTAPEQAEADHVEDTLEAEPPAQEETPAEATSSDEDLDEVDTAEPEVDAVFEAEADADAAEPEPEVEVEAFMAGIEAAVKEQDAPEEDVIEDAEAPVDEASVDVVTAEPVAPRAAPAPDSIAAKLQRIRAVVSRNEQVVTEADYSEDEHSEDAFTAALPDSHLDETTDTPTPRAEDAAEDAIEDTFEDAIADTAEVSTEDSDEDLPAPTETETAADLSEEPHEETAGDEADPMMARRAARLQRRLARAQLAGDTEKVAEVEAALEALTAPAPEAHHDAPRHDEALQDDEALFADLDRALKARASEPAENILADDPDAGYEEDGEDDYAAVAEALEPRVMMVKHAKAHEAEQPREAAPVVPSVELPPSTLQPDDEAELMRELAEVEAELRGEAAKAQAPEQVEPARDEAQQADTAREEEEAERKSRAAKSDLSRLMAAADEKLEAPEATSTREAYSHLRAAVAATRAERSAGGSVGDSADTEAYRDDLARVVQPRRPKPAGAHTRRPTAPDQQRPAPLKLVAEQRIDEVAEIAAKTGPVHPRRVSAQIEAPAPTNPDESFVAFAEEMGVQELPELLEAAAAYMQFVEGRDQFTRPQLIHKAREAVEGDFSREDGLRAFGTLLREGKILKTENGRFIAAHDIGFQPASRAAG